MAELDINVTTLRPKAKDVTGALRAKRFRRKRKARPAVTVPVPAAKNAQLKKPNDIKADVTVAGARPYAADVTAYLAAIALAVAAAWFSIRGMVVLFPGSPTSVVGMAVAMEGAKLVTAGWLARRWRATAWVWRLVLVALLAGLAIINAAGVYAQLVAAHVGDRGAAQSAIETQDAALTARIEVAAHVVDDLDRRLGQIDTAIETAAKRGKAGAALSAIESQKKARAGLAGERNEAASTLAALKAVFEIVAADKATGGRLKKEAHLRGEHQLPPSLALRHPCCPIYPRHPLPVQGGEGARDRMRRPLWRSTAIPTSLPCVVRSRR